MELNTVTVTGADESIHPGNLVKLSCKYPFAEWGILLSESGMGRKRFPSALWMEGLEPELQLSGHLCGKWVRQVCKGDWSWRKQLPKLFNKLNRIQLNFHAITHTVSRDFLHELDKNLEGRQVIFQLDDVNNDILNRARDWGIDAVPLFDLSGGKGVLPKEWPVARECYCGYAGGLSPDNVNGQLGVIKTKVPEDHSIWIDAETHVRSDNDKQFDLEKVELFLDTAGWWIGEEKPPEEEACTESP